MDEPRILPATEADWNDDTRPMLEAVAAANDGRILNLSSTMARYPKLFKRWTVFGNHVLFGSALPDRERELVILRTGFVAGSAYEWAQHVGMARTAGCTDAEIERVAAGPDSPGWSESHSTLLRAVDELMADHCISDSTWSALRAAWSEQQCMDVVFAVGQYSLVSMALKTFGVQIEDGVELFPPALFENGPLR